MQPVTRPSFTDTSCDLFFFTSPLLPYSCLAQQECLSPRSQLRILITHQNVKSFSLEHSAGNSVLTNTGKASCICEVEGRSIVMKNRQWKSRKVSAAEEGQNGLGIFGANTRIAKHYSFSEYKAIS